MLSFRSAARTLRSAAILLSATVLTQAAVVTLTPTVTNLGGGLYDYAYSISYTGTDDAFLVDISTPASPGAVINPMTPAGFKSQFDSVLGLVSFLEDTNTFTSTPTSGFSFTSPDAPGADSFSASILSLTTGTISTVNGVVAGPISAVPEPGFFYLLALLAPLSLYWNRRKVETSNKIGSMHING